MTTTRLARTLGLLLVPALLVAVPTIAAADAGACDDELVRHAPDGSHGEVGAVAITSQVLVADVDGWDRVGWQAADGVEVRTVLVTADGGTTEASGGSAGDLGPAETLTFCGTEVAATPAGAATSEGGDATVAASTGGPLSGPSLSVLGIGVGGLLAAVVMLLSRGARRRTSHAPRRGDRTGRPGHEALA